MAKVILASTSPRRKEILGAICSDFEIIKPIAEETDEGLPSDVALINAVNKGHSVDKECDLLIACDTVVALDGVIYGKPGSEARAIEMLGKLQGREHTVISGVYLRIKGTEYAYTVESKVKIRALSLQAVTEYVDKCRPLDKAGAYGIQDGEIVESFQGDYDNIVGLPTERIKTVIRDLDI